MNATCRVLRRFVPSSVLLLTLLSSAASASDTPVDSTAEARRTGLFPAFKKRDKTPEAAEIVAEPAPETETPEGGPAPDAPALERPVGGVFEWVERMDGEIPSAAQLAGVDESTASHEAQLSLVDDLAGASVPVRFYEDPVAALAVDPLFLDLVDPTEFDIPIVVNPAVAKWVRYFTTDGRKHYERWLGRSTRFQPMMRERLKAAGLPEDLVYLSMIESGYNANAYSHADAAGLWQFIASTGKLYDLRIDWWVDDRRDPSDSLDAAITFLGELRRMQGDWPLAWASYNGGPGRVKRAIDKSGTRDFWKIADGAFLHPETENYVPKIMAAAIIGKHPERYGFTDITFQDALVYDTVHVDGSVELAVLATCAGTTLDVMKELNPALRRYATPPEGYDVRVPVGVTDTFVVALAAVPKEQRVATTRHTVGRGETLSTIASKYHTSVGAISSANNLKNVNRITVGMSLVIPRSGSALAEAPPPTRAPAASQTRTASSPAPSRPSTHVVSRGDTLSDIATRYDLTVTQLKSANGLSSNTIVVGQRLKLGSSESGSSKTSTASSSAPRTHVVARGETLSVVADRYGVTMGDLQRWNGIRDASHIEVGQRLTVSGASNASRGSSTASASSWTTYTVRPGDSLGQIASRHGCSVGELQQWNSLSTSVIQPGQRLKIRKAA